MSARAAILLVGGTGFIGGALARRLAQERREVHVLCRNIPKDGPEHIHFHGGGQAQAELVGELLQRCGTVVHLASTTTPGASAKSPALEAEENLLPALRFLEALQSHPPDRLILASSGGTVYGDPAILPAGETLPLRPRSYHGAGKVALEQFFGVFAEQTGVPLVVLRPSNVYGPGQSLRGGFGIVRHLLESARLGRTVEIWGDGEAVRDLLYIDDLTDACLSLLENAGACGAFNVGAGSGTSIKQLCRLVERISQRKLAIVYRPGRSCDVKAIVLDNRKLADATHWQARTPLQEGLEKTWAWMLQHEAGRP